ncbi:MAG TPA: DUF4382 domain-containing protein [Nitrospiraceae bacterium]|nr:DUF4382 domain-containing protein [Nitrospiraceae bacterium]
MNTSKNCFNSVRAVMAVLLGFLLIGCGSGGSGSGGSSASGGGTGTMAVSLTDDPACGFNAVYVTPNTVRVHQSSTASDTDPGWTDITLNPPQKINLLNLNNGTLLSLGQAPLTAGHYQQLRLVLVPNSNNPLQPLANSVVLMNSTTEIALATPSAVQSGIKLVHDFDVAAGQHVDVVLEFNACNSIVARNNGSYALKPVIQVMTDVLNNGIDGFVAMSLLTNNVVVTAQQNGTVVRTTVPNTQTGEFFLGLLPTDATHCPSFPCHFDVVITADGNAAAVIASVPIASNTSITNISTSTNPFTLQASNSQSISGTVTLSNPATDEGMVLVGAKQTLNSGPTVTIKSQVAMVLLTTPTVGDYSYNLTLPVGAPLLYPYSTPLPLTLSSTNQSTVAGVYTVVGTAQVLQADGSTTTYATQNPAPHSVATTSTTGVTGNNFSLSP